MTTGVRADMRMMRTYTTGTGRTLRELLPIFRPDDELLVGAEIGTHIAASTARVRATRWSGERRIAAEGLARRWRLPHVFQPWMYGPVGDAATLLGIYDLIPLRFGGIKAALLRERLTLVASREDVHVVTLAAATATRLQSDYGIPARRLHVARPGTVIGEAVETPSGGEDVESRSAPGLLSVTRLSPHKGVNTLVDAWVLGGRPVPLTLVLPPGDAGAKAHRLRSLGVGVHCNLRAADLQALVSGATAVAVPSLEEGFGLPLVEAVSQGRPVLASDIPEFRELGCEAVTWAAPGNTAEWAAAIRSLASGGLSRTSFAGEAPTWDGWRASIRKAASCAYPGMVR